tara:strand:+ start:1386 stop:1724 length:339 start_codon:yes stop_codon:yes gene_type:complete
MKVRKRDIAKYGIIMNTITWSRFYGKYLGGYLSDNFSYSSGKIRIKMDTVFIHYVMTRLPIDTHKLLFMVDVESNLLNRGQHHGKTSRRHRTLHVQGSRSPDWIKSDHGTIY